MILCEETSKLVLEQLKVAAQAKLVQWDAEREIEELIGKTFRNMDSVLGDICAAGGSNPQLADYLDMLEEE